MINRPKQPTFYPERVDDCVEAIAARFDELAASLHGAFIDRESIAATLLSEASWAGWAQHEIDQAIDILGARRRSTSK